MKEREYYERLISDSLDRELSGAESEELERAVQRDPYLGEFRRGLLAQAEVMRSLPRLDLPAPLRKIPERTRSLNPLLRWWNIRVSVPVPVAAVLALTLFAVGVLNVVRGLPREHPDEDREAQRTDYVQVERFEPASAILIEDKPDKMSLPKENL